MQRPYHFPCRPAHHDLPSIPLPLRLLSNIMTHEQTERYKSALLKLRTALDQQIEQNQDARAPVTVDGRMGRISRGDAMQAQQVALEAHRRREQQRLRVRSALERIEDGTYGLCGRCRTPITAARLEAMPDVVMCVKCATHAGGRR